MQPIMKLIDALIMVESGGDNNAIGDNGKAKGCLQIHDCVVQDINNNYGCSYIHDDCFSRGKSVALCRMYLSLWGDEYERITGEQPSDEVLARIWNGGPRGWQKQSTVPYWNKVKFILKGKAK